jgi:hypothetical protein
MNDDELVREADDLTSRYAEHYDAEHAEAIKDLVRLSTRRLFATSRLVAEARTKKHIKSETMERWEQDRFAARQALEERLEVVRRAVTLAMARKPPGGDPRAGPEA